MMTMEAKKRVKIGRIAAVLYSVAALALHAAALGCVYRQVNLLLFINGMENRQEKDRIYQQANSLKVYSDYFTYIFLGMCLIALIILGILLVLRKINLLEYGVFFLVFWGIQIVGICLFSWIFNNHEISGAFSRIRIVFWWKMTWLIIGIPLGIWLLRTLAHRFERKG